MLEGAVRSPERAVRMLARIGEIARTDPALYADALRFQADEREN